MSVKTKQKPEQQTKELLLVEPSQEYRESYLSAAREFHEIGAFEQGTYAYVLGYDMQNISDHFPAYVDRINRLAEKGGIPPGRCPEKVFWLIHDGEYIGKVSIRFELNEYLQTYGGHIGYNIRPSKRRLGYGTRALALSLERARELGISRVLVTCDDDNIASRKIIERNGGKFESSIPHDRIRNKRKLRYWFEA